MANKNNKEKKKARREERARRKAQLHNGDAAIARYWETLTTEERSRALAGCHIGRLLVHKARGEFGVSFETDNNDWMFPAGFEPFAISGSDEVAAWGFGAYLSSVDEGHIDARSLFPVAVDAVSVACNSTTDEVAVAASYSEIPVASDCVETWLMHSVAHVMFPGVPVVSTNGTYKKAA